MKKWIALILVLAMTMTMTGCGCEHVAGTTALTKVDTAKLTAKAEVTCCLCGKVMDRQKVGTGFAPQNGAMCLSPVQWFECLTTNIVSYDTSGMLVPMPVESEDGALLQSIVSPTGYKSVISFYDSEGNVITTQQGSTGGVVHTIRVEAQFDNNTATVFYTMLMLIAATNNSSWTNEGTNDLATRVMQGETVTDNGYTYTMEILSPIYHTVAVDITAQ